MAVIKRATGAGYGTRKNREEVMSIAVEAQPALSPESRRALIAGIAGNVMEWYDFAVCGYFASVIGRQFFPAQDRTSSLLAAFGVFAAGFVIWPISSPLFGHIGDSTTA